VRRRGKGVAIGITTYALIVFDKACELGLEGIVSKRAGRFYKNGRSRSWLKLRNPGFVRT
jgi:ATP-dependent DNA ligase